MTRRPRAGRVSPFPKDGGTCARRIARSEVPEVREKVLLLSVLFGDKEAIASLRTTVGDAKADEAARRTALQTLVEAKAADLPLLRDLLGDRVLRGSARPAPSPASTTRASRRRS